MSARPVESMPSCPSSLDALWKFTSDLIIEYDRQLRITSANPAAQDFIRYDLLQKNLEGETNSRIFGESFGAEIDRRLREVRTDRKARLVEFRISTQRKPRIFESLIIYSEQEDSEDSRLIVVHRDITEKRARFTEMADELAQQKDFLLNVIRTSPNPIFVKNQRGQYVYLNEAASAVHGKTPDELLGVSDEELNTSTALEFRRQDLEVISNSAGISFEEQVNYPDGKVCWYRTTKRPFKDPRTNETYILGNAVDVTKMKEVEQSIRERETLLRGIISSAPIVVCALDENGIFTLSEGRGLIHLNLKPGEVVGKSVFDLYCDYPEVLATVRQVLEQRIEISGVYKVQGRVFETTFIPFGDNQGLVCVAYDITERYDAEAALKFTQFSIDKSGEAAFWINSSGHFVYVNDKACRLSGYSRSELLSKTIHDLGPQKHAGHWATNWKRIRRTKSALAETELRTKDGKFIPIEISQNFIRFDDKEYNCAFVKEISERKRAQKALLESERRFRTMADSSPAFIWMFDREANCRYVNQSFLNFLGWPAEKTLGDGWKSAVHPEDREKYRDYLQGKVYRSRLVFEGRVLRHDNRYRWILAHGVPQNDENDEASGYLVSGMDITERKEAAEALQKAARELERSNRELEQFAYVASHDLQEPLRMISGFCELMHEQYQGKLDSQADEYLDYILDGSTRMSALIRDLLLYSRCSRPTMSSEVVDCSQIIRSVQMNLKHSLEKTKTHLILGDLPKIQANEYQLVQLFQNLIENAVKYRSTERAPEVVVSAIRKNGEWIFSIKDNGRGFDMRNKDRVFQIFQRLEKRGSIAGSGIGLSIAKKIVENAGGQIWVESAPGEGSTFYFSWPAREALSI